jgi:hypothetical protein
MKRIPAALMALLLASCGSSLKATGTADGGPDDGHDVTLVDTESEPDADPDVPPDIVTDIPADTSTDPGVDAPPGACVPVDSIPCGGSVDSANDASGSTSRILTNDCYGAEWSGPEIAWSLTFPDDLRAEIELSGFSGDLDLFLFAQNGGDCDTNDCLATSLSGEGRDERMIYMGTAGETVYIMVDGYEGSVSSFHLDAACVVPEDCDDDVDNDGDTVTDCDDPECRWVLPCYEDICDDGIDNDDDGPTDCEDFDCMSLPECPTTCTPTASVECGGRYYGDTRLPGTADEIDRYSCGTWDESGPEDVASFTATSDTRVTAQISGHSVDLDIFVLEDTGSGCVNTNCIAYHNNTVRFDVTSGHTYYILIDGYLGVSGDYNLEIVCGGGP